MDASELATKMLEWEKRKRELDALTSEIEKAVLSLEKTQVVGKVRATYSGGRATYDYQAACNTELIDDEIIERYSTDSAVTDWDAVADMVPEVVAKFTTHQIVYDYRAICKAASIEPVVLSKTPPTVTVKLEG